MPAVIPPDRAIDQRRRVPALLVCALLVMSGCPSGGGGDGDAGPGDGGLDGLDGGSADGFVQDAGPADGSTVDSALGDSSISDRGAVDGIAPDASAADGFVADQGLRADASACREGAEETCDGRDEDCDGVVDEDLDDPMDVPVEARCPSVGVCADRAVSRCEDGRWICDLPAEFVDDECPATKADCDLGSLDDATCDDGVDNDCDGERDERSPQARCAEHPDFRPFSDGEACFASPHGRCGMQGGDYACVELEGACGVDIICVGATAPEPERCERLDWDCDGHVANRNDRDGDGFGDCDGRFDCDEGDANVHPGALEVCNQIDDDCDGRTDEGTLNACGQCGAVPRELCNGRDDDCNGVVDDIDPAAGNACGQCGPPPREVCNGADDDCDGRTDEGVLNACGQCGAVPRELCNGRDDDCNGVVDDIDPAAGNACGRCGPPPREVCNGADDDCDGRTDEGVLNACGRCGAVPAEVCNRADDDCDGRIDEGVRNACGGCGAVPAERCDGLDNDCDGRVDESGPADEPEEVLVEMSTDARVEIEGRVGAPRDLDTYDVFANEALQPDFGCNNCAQANERTRLVASLRVPADAGGPYQLCVRADNRPTACVNVDAGGFGQVVNDMAGQNCCNGFLCDQDNSTHFFAEVRGINACSFAPYVLSLTTAELCVP